jgi:2-methylcitrate dehydratase PrpD
VKPVPACAVLQGPLEVALRLRATAGGTRIEAAHLVLSPFEATFPGIDNPGPAYSGPAAAKMSAQFCLGAAFANGRLALADLSRTEDTAILNAARRVSVSGDPGLRDRQCRLEIRLAGGRSLTDRLNGAIGRPDFAGVAEFARRLASEIGTTPETVDRLVAEVDAIETRTTLDRLLAAIAALRVPATGVKLNKRPDRTVRANSDRAR